MAQFHPDKRTVLSVYPLARQIEMKHLGVTLYSLPEAENDKIIIREPMVFGRPIKDDVVKAVKPGDGYVLLNVYDTFQYIRDLMSDDTSATIPMPIDAQTVGNSIVEIWGNPSMGVTFGPGIKLIEGDAPTAEELTYVRDRQYNYFVALVQDGDSKERRGESHNITDVHRRACTSLGVERPWNVRIRENQITKPCPACARDILSAALVCQHCHVNLVKFYEEMGIDASGDSVVMDVLRRRTGSKATTPVTPGQPIAPKPMAPPLTTK